RKRAVPTRAGRGARHPPRVGTAPRERVVWLGNCARRLCPPYLSSIIDGPTFMPASQHQSPKSDIEIAQAAQKRPIMELAREKLGIAPENLEPYGHYKAKVS